MNITGNARKKMEFVIKGMKYNTEKMEKVAEVKK